MIKLPNKKYKIIYADVPWTYDKYRNTDERKSTHKHKITPYSALSVEELKQITVSKISEKDSVLLFWVTYPNLPDGLDIIKAWGFEFKTVAFTWVKKNKNGTGFHFGLGHYTRANAEICLLATRGKGLKVLRKDIPQICDLPIKSHSEKPDEIRKRIVQLFGDLPRIELFGRIKPHGWDVLGDDAKLDNMPLEAFAN